MRARLIVAAILFVAFGASIAMLALDIGKGGSGTEIRTKELSPYSTAAARPEPPLIYPGSVPRIPSVTSNIPSGIINLTDWKLTLPAGDDDDEPVEIGQPKLTFFRDPQFFHVDPLGSGVVFRAPVGGATTANSSYPRSELREMVNGGKEEASWSGKSGTHVMTLTQAITALPKEKPEVVAGQIHDDEDDVVMLRLNGSRLFVEADDGNAAGTLDPNYTLGTRFTVQFVATDGRIQVTYNGLKTVELKHSGKGNYFKAGCYTQSNEDDDGGNVYGEVVIYALTVQHS